MPALHEIVIADEPARWAALGFAVEGDTCRVGSILLRLAGPGAGEGIVSWGLRDLAGTELDGLPTTAVDAAAPEGPAPEHPNGALGVDHVVVFTPTFERTRDALVAAGLDLRRVREGIGPDRPFRFGFFRVGDAILELVDRGGDEGAQPDDPPRFWGLVCSVSDLDAAASLLGDSLGTVRDAVQPGRRIATVGPEAGVSAALALMTPR